MMERPMFPKSALIGVLAFCHPMPVHAHDYKSDEFCGHQLLRQHRLPPGTLSSHPERVAHADRWKLD
jgi:hypothetical protein